MRILITGNMGYVGPVVVAHLRATHPNAELIGMDCGLFANCLVTDGPTPETLLDAQRFADLRDITTPDLRGVDTVVHLAAISNDPIGNRFTAATDAINRGASLRLAACAAQAGVQHFVFASSCSVYGLATTAARREEDPVAPLSEYARSKVATEQGLAELNASAMTITCLRFATACGFSPRLRLDLVLNDFVACALATRHITVLSDGTPWRPLIDVQDMARAIEWAVWRDAAQGGRMLVVNVGANGHNHQVQALAQAVADAVPGTSFTTNAAAPPDARSYRVDFSRFAELAPRHQPCVPLDRSIAGLVSGLRSIGFHDAEFRTSARTIRLNTIARLLAEGSLTPELRWAWRQAA